MASTSSILPPVGDLRGQPPQPPRGGNGNGGGRGPAGAGPHVAVLGIWVALAPILMLFLAFVSAYIVRQGLGSDWRAIPVPGLLWGNTLVLLCSSVLLERARRIVRHGLGAMDARPWFLATLLCGVAFMVGQGVVWNQLLARGIGISSSAHSSFFYLLTGAHAVHVAGGLMALTAAAFWPATRFGMSREVVARVTTIYWHFMGILWLGLFVVLSFWR
jgi:cytochrome c oxidase subunit 3